MNLWYNALDRYRYRIDQFATGQPQNSPEFNEVYSKSQNLIPEAVWEWGNGFTGPFATKAEADMDYDFVNCDLSRRRGRDGCTCGNHCDV